MGKIISVLMLVIAIEFGLFWFAGTAQPNNSVVSLVLNPVDWETSGFYIALYGILTALSLVGLIAGAVFSRLDWAIYAGIAVSMATFLASIVKLWQLISSQLGELGFASANLVASIMCAPLIIAVLMIILDYPRGRD